MQNNHESKRGSDAEKRFAKELLSNVTWATTYQDIHEHWDVMGKLHEKTYKFDVKALRRINRNDSNLDDDITWIEGTNVIGNRGWLRGDADYIVFERMQGWMVINRAKLFDWVMQKLKENNLKEGKGLYQIYQRPGRKDKLTMIRYSDIPKNFDLLNGEMKMSQKDINDAVDYLYTHGRKYGEAKAHRTYLEEYRKSQKAMLMKAAMSAGIAKTVAAAEIEAYADPVYIEVLKGLEAAVEREEELRWGLVSAQARIDVWRSNEASNRVMDKAAA